MTEEKKTCPIYGLGGILCSIIIGLMVPKGEDRDKIIDSLSEIPDCKGEECQLYRNICSTREVVEKIEENGGEEKEEW